MRGWRLWAKVTSRKSFECEIKKFSSICWACYCFIISSCVQQKDWLCKFQSRLNILCSCNAFCLSYPLPTMVKVLAHLFSRGHKQTILDYVCILSLNMYLKCSDVQKITNVSTCLVLNATVSVLEYHSERESENRCHTSEHLNDSSCLCLVCQQHVEGGVSRARACSCLAVSLSSHSLMSTVYQYPRLSWRTSHCDREP